MSTTLIILVAVLVLRLISSLIKLISIGPNSDTPSGAESDDMATNTAEEPPYATPTSSVAPLLESIKTEQKAVKQQVPRKQTATATVHAATPTTRPTRGADSKTDENSGVLGEIADNFDLRSAVIYSEIMTPKFKDNE